MHNILIIFFICNFNDLLSNIPLNLPAATKDPIKAIDAIKVPT